MRPPAVKRAICRHYARGFCGLGIKCGFAHGDSELGTARPAMIPRSSFPIPVPPGPGRCAMDMTLKTIEAGAVLTLKEPATIFASVSSWEPIGSLAEGEQVVAAGPPESIVALNRGYWMVPVRPRGAIDSSALAVQTENGGNLASSGARQLNSGGLCYEWARGICLKGSLCKWPHILLPGAAPAAPAPPSTKSEAAILEEVHALLKAAEAIGAGATSPEAVRIRSATIPEGSWTCACGKSNRLAKLQCIACDSKRSAEIDGCEGGRGLKRCISDIESEQKPAGGEGDTEASSGKGRRRVFDPLMPKGFKGLPPSQLRVQGCVKGGKLGRQPVEVPPRPLEERSKPAEVPPPQVRKGVQAPVARIAIASRLMSALARKRSMTAQQEKAEGEAIRARGLWLCPSCAEPNKDTRTNCNACGGSREAVAQTKAVQTDLSSVVELEDVDSSSAVNEGNSKLDSTTEHSLEMRGALNCFDEVLDRAPGNRDEDETVEATDSDALNVNNGPSITNGAALGAQDRDAADNIVHDDHADPTDSVLDQTEAVESRISADRWECVACGENNNFSRSHCNSCDAPRALTTVEDVAAVGCSTYNVIGCSVDCGVSTETCWVCPRCGEDNKASRSQCNSCGYFLKSGASTTSSPSAPQVVPPRVGVDTNRYGCDLNSWECLACGDENKAIRSHCNGCGLARGSTAVGNTSADFSGDAAKRAQAWADMGKHEKTDCPASRQESWAAEDMPAAKLCAGSMVKICDLTSKPELNGRIVECESFDGKSGRWTVVTADDERFRLREANLQLTDGWQASFGL